VTAYRDQVELALRAAAVTSSTSYAWFGRRARAVPAGATLPARAYLVRALEGTLYRSFYTQGVPVPVSGLLPVPAPPIAAFVAALSEANAGHGGWQPGWQIVDTGPEELTVARAGLRVQVAASECRRAEGSTASLPRANEHRDASPGFYTAFGDEVPDIGDDDVELRVYFHLTAAGAAPFVASCTRVLNRAGVAFVLKVVDNPAAFVRCDAAVLYLAGFPRAELRQVVAASAPDLRAPVPAFGKPIAAGVAVGEHRATLGGSFGSSRCRLVAEGLVDAHEHGERDRDARLNAVERRFAASGLSLQAPYLVAGSADGHAL
jgi:hypothetical protein